MSAIWFADAASLTAQLTLGQIRFIRTKQYELANLNARRSLLRGTQGRVLAVFMSGVGEEERRGGLLPGTQNL
jgi:hypothetical protein